MKARPGIGRSSLFILCVLLYSSTYAQTFYEKFKALSYETDTAEQRQLLQEWEAADKNDPQLYVSYFNYYLSISRSSMLAINKNLPEGYNDKSLSFADSSGETAGFIYNHVQYEPKTLNKGFDYINAGIKKFPDRLDMRFGKVHMLGEIQDYEAYTKEIIDAINHSVQIKNKWGWIDGKPLEDSKNFMLGTIQDYELKIYDTGIDSLLIYMKQISEAVLKQYPDHVESLSNLSVYYLINKNNPAAIEQLEKAVKIAPEDYIVLGNLAQAYARNGDKKNAKKYFELMVKYGDADVKAAAAKELEKLK